MRTVTNPYTGDLHDPVKTLQQAVTHARTERGTIEFDTTVDVQFVSIPAWIAEEVLRELCRMRASRPQIARV